MNKLDDFKNKLQLANLKEHHLEMLDFILNSLPESITIHDKDLTKVGEYREDLLAFITPLVKASADGKHLVENTRYVNAFEELILLYKGTTDEKEKEQFFNLILLLLDSFNSELIRNLTIQEIEDILDMSLVDIIELLQTMIQLERNKGNLDNMSSYVITTLKLKYNFPSDKLYRIIHNNAGFHIAVQGEELGTGSVWEDLIDTTYIGNTDTRKKIKDEVFGDIFNYVRPSGVDYNSKTFCSVYTNHIQFYTGFGDYIFDYTLGMNVKEGNLQNNLNNVDLLYLNYVRTNAERFDEILDIVASNKTRYEGQIGFSLSFDDEWRDLATGNIYKITKSSSGVFTITVKNASGTTIPTPTLNKDLRLMAIFKATLYKLSFYSEGELFSEGYVPRGKTILEYYFEEDDLNSNQVEVPNLSLYDRVGYTTTWKLQIGEGWYEDFDYTYNTPIYKPYDVFPVYSSITTYTVRFYKYKEGTTYKELLKTEIVNEGGSATAPTTPTRTGYTWNGWQPSTFNNIMEDLNVCGTWTIKSYTVRFYDFEGTGKTLLKTQTVNHGSSATAPYPLPTRSGYVFDGWDKPFSSIIGNLDVYGTWVEGSPMEYSFIDVAMTESEAEAPYPSIIIANTSSQPIRTTHATPIIEDAYIMSANFISNNVVLHIQYPYTSPDNYGELSIVGFYVEDINQSLGMGTTPILIYEVIKKT